MSSRQKMNQGEYPERWKNNFFPYGLRKIYLNLGMVTIATLTVIFLGCSAQQKLAQAQLTPATSEWKADGIVAEGEYPQTLVLARGKYTVYWKNDDQFLYMALKAKTTGWVAIGLEPTSRMKDADMVFGWVKEGEATVLDLYSTGGFGPHPPDDELGGTNDLLEVGGTEENGYTTIEFKRKLNTQDQYDKVFTPGQTINFIWAMARADSFTVKHNLARGRGKLVLEEDRGKSARAWMDMELTDVATGKTFQNQQL